MRIRFVRPLPQPEQMHVYRTGQMLDAPEGFARKMIRQGFAVAVQAGEAGEQVRKTAAEDRENAMALALEKAVAEAHGGEKEELLPFEEAEETAEAEEENGEKEEAPQEESEETPPDPPEDRAAEEPHEAPQKARRKTGGSRGKT